MDSSGDLADRVQELERFREYNREPLRRLRDDQTRARVLREQQLHRHKRWSAVLATVSVLTAILLAVSEMVSHIAQWLLGLSVPHYGW